MWHRVGVGVLDPAMPALALFVPSAQPVVTVSPSGHGEHAARVADWALRVLGGGATGGHLVLISEPSAARWAECLVIVMAVDDAAAGGHRPDHVLGSGLLDRVLHDPHQVAGLAAAARL